MVVRVLKIALVVPVFNGGAKEEASSYRPISILPILSKVYERAIYDQIVSYCETSDIFYEHQYGFRKFHSTQDAVLKLTDHCVRAFEAGEYCITVFLDLSRAFDSVSHRILLEKLKSAYKFDHLSLTLIESYLTGRQQCVIGGASMSGRLTVRRGVPQGSILGPLLFLLFFNDFASHIKIDSSIECILYADDSTIVIRGTDFDNIIHKLNIVMDRVRQWSVANEIVLNERKTVEMALGLRRFNFENPDFCKFLGVVITPPFLRFDGHVDMIGPKVNRGIFVLRRLASTVDRDVLRSAYFALVHSHLSYCILAWGNTPICAQLFKLQRRAIRVLGGLGYADDCRAVFIDRGILTLPSQFVLECVIYGQQHCSSYRANSHFHDHDTRGRHNIRLDRCRLTRTQRGTDQICKALYNKLPPGARNLTNASLKRQLKSYLCKKAFYSLDEFLNCGDVTHFFVA